jgi:hypothetical protein
MPRAFEHSAFLLENNVLPPGPLIGVVNLYDLHGVLRRASMSLRRYRKRALLGDYALSLPT